MPYPRLFCVVCCLLLSPLAAPSGVAAAENNSLHAALLSITSDELRAHVDVLADDSFEGREAGSRGGHAAGGYLAQRLEEYGLAGGGPDGSYFQSFGNGFRNVVGVLEGSDPELKHELVVLGAHYDHVGYGSQENSFGPFGYVHNGADDNASGVAALLEILDAVRNMPTPPRRSILVGFWDGEEKGLLGSKHWVTYPTVSLDRVVFAVNVDMIGRLRDGALEVYGTRSAQGLRRMLSEANADGRLLLDFSWEMKSNSDHYSFYEANIPVLMFHTGLHDDYHRPSDDAHLVNPDGMRSVSRFMLNILYELTARDALAEFRTESYGESPLDRRQLEESIAAAPPRLGVRWQPAGEGEAGIRITEVEPESAADRGGLQVGDRLLKLAGEELVDGRIFRRAVLAARSPVIAEVQRDSQDPVEVTLELDGKPTRIGISWREDHAEPGSVILTRVLPGSPADSAGLEAGDRLYEIDGRRFRDTMDLFESLTSLPSPIGLVVEREGQLRQVELQVVDAGT